MGFESGRVFIRIKNFSVSIMKKVFVVLFIALFSILLGCASKTSDSSGTQTRIFTDSAGREVEIPVVITSVAPTGPLSQVVLYMACPDMLAGISMDFPENAKGFIPEKYYSLQKFGQFYGRNASLNMEALIAAAPDVIIDVGEAKEHIAQDMDNLQKQLGIPVVFVEATLETIEKSFLMLGDLTGDKERADRLGEYCRSTIEHADSSRQFLHDNEKVRVYMATGQNGLNTNAKDSFHADVLRKVGAENVVDIESSTLGAGSEVSFEQILIWNPQVILVDSALLYEKLNSDPIWRQVEAIQTGRVYKIPAIPYSFITNPPAANRIIGIRWLGWLLYTEQYKINIEDEVRFFFKEFYSIDLSEEQYQQIMLYALLGNASYASMGGAKHRCDAVALWARIDISHA